MESVKMESVEATANRIAEMLAYISGNIGRGDITKAAKECEVSTQIYDNAKYRKNDKYTMAEKRLVTRLYKNIKERTEELQSEGVC